MTYVQAYSRWTIQLMENDLRTFEAVVKSPEFDGKLGVAMVTNACAALNFFGWLIHQKFDLSRRDNEIFNRIIGDERFFTETDFIDRKVLYSMVRCAVVHQFYPAGMGMVATDSPHVFHNFNGKLVVNALAFYQKVQQGLIRVDTFISNAEDEVLRDLDLRLQLRLRMDAEVADIHGIDLSKLPTDLGKGGAIDQF